MENRCLPADQEPKGRRPGLDGRTYVRVSEGGPGTCAFLPRGVPHAWKNAGAEPCRVLFLYAPARAGKFFEELVTHPAGEMNGDEANEMRRRHRWEVLGLPPTF